MIDSFSYSKEVLNMSMKLSKCPFCGSAAEFTVFDETVADSWLTVFQIRCVRCTACIEHSARKSDIAGKKRAIGALVRLWNTRVNL